MKKNITDHQNKIDEDRKQEKQCKVCNYAWLAKLEEPKQCPYCKSMKWNIERKTIKR